MGDVVFWSLRDLPMYSLLAMRIKRYFTRRDRYEWVHFMPRPSMLSAAMRVAPLAPLRFTSASARSIADTGPFACSVHDLSAKQPRHVS